MTTLPPVQLVVVLVATLALFNIATAQAPPPSFKCTSTSTCQSLIGYTPTKPTTLSEIKTLFQVPTFNSLLGPNNLPTSTPPNFAVSTNTSIRVPIPCRCLDGTGQSDHVPVYHVVKDDGLYMIANGKFSGLVEFHQIQKANNISNPDLILVGQKLWIPLPCSCDEVDGSRVVHYAHVVKEGSSVEAIATEFGTTSQTLMSVNGITDPKKLIAGQVLDVPLKVCSSSVKSNSMDYPMLVASNSYTVTANDCVKCNCNSTANFTLQCEESGLKPKKWTKCPESKCSSGLTLGNSTKLSSCTRTSCAYTGYNNDTILANLVNDSICPAPPSLSPPGTHKNSSIASRTSLTGWSLAYGLFLLVLMFQRFM